MQLFLQQLNVRAFLEVIGGFLEVYSIIIFVYIFASWIPGLRMTPIMQILANLVEPYFSLFRKFPFSRFGHFSLAPLYGLLFLKLLQFMINDLQDADGKVKLGNMLSFLLEGMWGIASFLLVFFAIIALIRFVFSFFPSYSAVMFTQILDMLLTLAVSFVSALFFYRRITNYRFILVLIIFLNVVFVIFGQLVIKDVSEVLKKLPI